MNQAKDFLRKRKIEIRWTCSDFVHHEHRWKWTAWLCGRWQWLLHRKPRREPGKRAGSPCPEPPARIP
jgi:hypothetical protein